ncbi:MAG: TorD/DmsD family molecular chaperone [Desulfosalsimonas sp.]
MKTNSLTLPGPDPYAGYRSDIYALLAALLGREPNPDMLSWLQELLLPPDLPPACAGALADLRQEAIEKPHAAVQNEFQDLFLVPGGGCIIPYGSWYHEGLLAGKFLAHLRTSLAELGIGRREGFCEPEDHAALIFETMALLNQRKDISPESYNRFFEQHVASWMFAFFSDLKQAEAADFYRSVSNLGTVLLNWEKKHKGA